MFPAAPDARLSSTGRVHARCWRVLLAVAGVLLAGCSDRPLNDPYPADHSGKSILYDSFAERPKHLDPVSSYSENEAKFLGQIYEPIVQYHFLKRPYELTTLTATAVPKPEYLDADGNPLPSDAPGDAIAQAVYRITIQPGIKFQPHPAFATDDSGSYRYHALTGPDLDDVQRLDDFAHTGTRELTAEDYVYQVKRLVHPHLHSPIAGFMAKYIVGLDELAGQLRESGSAPGEYIDLRDFEIAGVQAVDKYTYEIRLKEKYPQFVYWLAMSFFAPVPWEADAFYFQPGMKKRNLTMDWYPIGTGPYMLTENNPNRRMVLERNPNFRGEAYPDSGEPEDRASGMLADAGKRMPFIDVAYYSLEKEAIPEWNKFLQGYFDTAGILSDSFDQAIQFNAAGEAGLTPTMSERGIGLLTAITASISYIGFNMTDETIGGYSEEAVKLRRAISIAMDYEELISIFANGRGVAAQGPIPPGIFGNRDGDAGINPYIYEWRGDKRRRRSIDEARTLLGEAGYPGGRSASTGEPLVLYFE
ncbi:MAG: peptide ABC transporter substrate-binding protein, partial [Gammaproteobacteria bacterium]|nr:peptide ABC transporter substrate-binding protein [Gammaproteobacteria bacterium]